MLGDLPPGACGQVRDVGRRFALVGFAGELATAWGILPWEEGAARVAARSMMRRWLDARGGVGSSEDSEVLHTFRAFLLREGPSRFTVLKKDDQGRWLEASPDRVVANRAGWRRPDGEGRDEYLIEDAVWAVECGKLGLDPTRAAQVLRENGHLGPGDGKHLAGKVRIPGAGRPRCYCIRGSIFDGDIAATQTRA
jgi:uncharacterized protein (DUF927 family)